MKKALVVGINDYPGARLYGCINDANAVGDLLATNEDGSPNFDVHVEEGVFTKSDLRTKIVDLFKGNCETVLFYFAGHGFINELGGYIVTPDKKKYDEGILMDEVLKLANDSKAINKIIILDCCHSGVMGNPGILSKGASYMEILGYGPSYLHEGVTIMTASRPEEKSGEINGHGVFTNLLVEALKGGAADLGGYITAGSIYTYIDQALGPRDQRPVFKTNTTRFSPLRTIRPQISREVMRKITEYFSAPDSMHDLDPSYEDKNTPNEPHFIKEPYANEHNVTIFKHLQQYQGMGLVTPVDAPFMFFAAMNSKPCKLTPLGQHYWALVKNKRI